MNVGARKPSDSVISYASAAIGQPPLVASNMSATGPNIAKWIDRPLLEKFGSEGTDAHRLCTINDGWVERFGREVLISFKNTSARDRLILELYFWRTSLGVDVSRVFGRFLPKKNEEREKPQLLFGDGEENLQTIATEAFLKYKIDFAAGYSVGLFIDQRENRKYVRQSKPKRLLNCFAYTCSFSVAAASVGAETVSVDLSKKSLERGRENFALNSLTTANHRFITDDVMAVLPRLERRGEKFDMIILDPPTFSRTKGGAAFHVEKDLEELIAGALEIAGAGARILISTNCESLTETALERMARYGLKLLRRAGSFRHGQRPADFPPGSGAKTIWLTLH